LQLSGTYVEVGIRTEVAHKAGEGGGITLKERSELSYARGELSYLSAPGLDIFLDRTGTLGELREFAGHSEYDRACEVQQIRDPRECPEDRGADEPQHPLQQLAGLLKTATHSVASARRVAQHPAPKNAAALPGPTCCA